MSKEIVPFMDETQTPSATQPTHSSSKRPHRSGFSEYVECYSKIETKFNFISENHHLKHFFHPDKGHKYLNLFYPNPNTVKHILDTMKGPSLLYLRGCDHLLFSGDFHFAKFKTLTVLEISSIGNLTTIPEEIAEMVQLQSLNLSHLPIQRFPADDFFSKLTNLQSLVLKACPNLQSLPKSPPLALLVSLDLSHLSIEVLPDEFFSDMKKLQRLILRGCSILRCLPSMEPLQSLEFLDLSYTNLHCKTYPVYDYPRLTHVFCRDTKGSVYDSLVDQTNIWVLDLSGAKHVRRNFQLHHYTNFLEFVDLSRTSIESIEFSSSLSSISILLLRKCSRLVKLSGMNNLSRLKVFDISGCGSLSILPEELSELGMLEELNLCGCRSLRELREGIFDKMSCLKKLDLSKTKLKHLPSSAAKLTHRGTHLILSPQLSSNIKNNKLRNLEIIEDDVASPCPTSDDDEGNSNISHPNEFHLVSTFTNKDSPFKRYTDNFTDVKLFILSIQNISTANINHERMLADLEYILENIDLLESSDDKDNAGKLLHYLMNDALQFKADEFLLDPKNLKDLIRLVVKLKLLVPRPKQKDSNPKKTRKKKGDNTIPHYKNTKEEETFLSSYDSLTKAQKSCLLCFALLPSNPSFFIITIRERTLIHLWWGEGFIDDARLEQNALPSSPATIEETGQHILMILQEKSFIKRSSYSRYFILRRNVYYWVKKKAKAERFLDCMTPHKMSVRACLLKSQYKAQSSCHIWLNQTKASDQNQEYCFKNVRTLFNGNERLIDIRTEWFSKMRSLHVLHLGSWESKNDHIEVVDLNFLKELKNMKQLRLLHFEGVTGISKLPDSICKLSHLRMLNLRGCTQMEELPADIGLLQNLSHLDATLCPLLSMFPKGIKLLSNLEVLKGFLITCEFNGGQNKKACTLADLLELQKLRKLNLVVNLAKFPTSEDLQVFKEMKNLCNLQITWLQIPYVNQEIQDVIRRKASRPFRWQLLKCWEPQTQNDEAEEPIMTSSLCLEKLKKLVLCCFPLETAPDWLHPSELKNLGKLYILGGHLKTMPGDPNQNAWNVKTLRLKYALKLDIDWEILRQLFPKMTYLMKHPDTYLLTFPVVDGLWRISDEENQPRNSLLPSQTCQEKV